MSHFDEQNQPANPEHQLDLLVDGELSESDRRDLLLQLEHEPDGWRRCALAFLEAQCWKTALPRPAASAPNGLPETRLAPETKPSPRPESPELVPSRQTGRWRRLQNFTATALTIAASVLIALVIGKGFMGEGWGGHTPVNSTVKSAKDEFQLPNQKASNQPVTNQTVAAGPGNGWEMVTIAAANSPTGQGETYSVPAQRRDSLDTNLLEQMPDAIPPQVREALEQSGHRVVEQREIVPVEMSDGRRLVVPVDHVEIHTVGLQSF